MKRNSIDEKMAFSLTCFTAILFFLASIIVHSFEELVVLRDSRTTNGIMRNLTCISEDVNAALIWNQNIKVYPTKGDKYYLTNFQPRNPTSKKFGKCGIWNPTSCIANWKKNGSEWDVVDSGKRPTYPVLDYRWEDFKEYVFDNHLENEDYKYVRKLEVFSDTVVFSTRGLSDVYVFLCQNMNPNTGPCFWILLGGWNNKKSGIRYCGKGAPHRSSFSTAGYCDDIIIQETDEQILDAYEWRTFVLKWIYNKKSIEVYKGNESKPFLKKSITQRPIVPHLLSRSGTGTRLRFHFYEYFSTTNKNAIMSTVKFNHNNNNFCAEVLVGLCPECELNFTLTNDNDRNIHSKIISEEKKSLYNGMLNWRLVRLNVSINHFHSRLIKLKIQSILREGESGGRWAIDTIRTCRSVGDLRKSTITIYLENSSETTSWPTVNCQKLFYNDHSTVYPGSTSSIDDDTEGLQRFLQTWINLCGPSYSNLGENWSFCNPSGCTTDRSIIDYGTGENPCFKIEIRDTSLTVDIHSDWQKCKDLGDVTFLIKLQNTAVNNEPQERGTQLPTLFRDLTHDTTYHLTIFHISTKLLVKTFRTREGAPGKVDNLVKNNITDTEVSLQWTAPLEKHGVITHYEVSLEIEVLFGCDDLKKSTPSIENITQNVAGTKASIGGLHPHAKYTVTVIAHNSKTGLPQTREFRTNPKLIPTSVVSNLRFVDNNRFLEWDPPENCVTISGSVKDTRLHIRKVIGWVSNRIIDESTSDKYFDLTSLSLTPYTLYNVRVYVARNSYAKVNLDLYQEKNWTTSPDVPYAVRGLKVYDADPDTNTIPLRWQTPEPVNGEIESYHVSIIQGNRRSKDWTIKVSEGTPVCELWSDYICFRNLTLPPEFIADAQVQLQVYARNKNVQQSGEPYPLSFTPNFYYNQVPGKPRNLRAINQGHGIVLLTWSHPSISEIKITRFRIFVKITDTKLLGKSDTENQTTIDHRIERNQKEYRKKIYLATSTYYIISIASMNREKPSVTDNTTISVKDGFGFINEEKLQAVQNGILIKVTVPEIINATSNTVINVTVNGLMTCAKNQSGTSLTTIDESHLIVYHTNISTPINEVTIGTNQSNHEKLNCTLYLGNTYNITVLAKGTGSWETIGSVSISLTYTYLHLVWFASIPILAICLSLLWVCIRRRRTDARLYPKSAMSTDNLIALSTLKPSSSRNQSTQIQDRYSEDTYALPYEKNTRPVTAKYFPEYAKKAADSGLLVSQYMAFPRDLKKPCEYGNLPENMPKNRNKYIIAYDDTRVVLQKIPGDDYSDYINASYIQGHRGEKAYIATQGPMPNTINDFWRMVWQEKVYVICMLTNLIEDGKKNCEQYWPEVSINKKYGDVSVLNTEHRVYADYTIRNFRLTCQKYKRKIRQLHYTGWPDHGIPTYSQSLVSYLRRLVTTPTGNGPVLVHCSTGYGRTGTMILCDICCRQASEEKVIDVLAVTTRMRNSRADMVGNAQQYMFAHVIITENVESSITQIPCNDDFPKEIKRLRDQLQSDVERLNDTVWQERILYALVAPKSPKPGDFARERLPELDSVYPDVIYFERFSGCNNATNNYIGAVSVDGVKSKKEFLASQLPSNSTWSKFWLLIATKNVELIVILQRSSPTDTTCCDVMPRKLTFAPVPHILVETRKDICEEDHFTTEELMLTDTSGDKRRPQRVTVLTCTGWEKGKNGKPPTPGALVSLWIASQKIPRKESQTLVFCQDGVTGCGLYLALSFLLERMAVERECDVISAVRAVRRFRPEFIQSQEEFEYLYDAAENYISCFQTYSNFS